MGDADDDLTVEQAAARDALLADIRRVFPARRPEPFPMLVVDTWCNEVEQVTAAFENAKDWTVLDSEWLHNVPNPPNGLVSACSFLSPAALCFYLPAYLTAALALKLDPMFSLIYGFDERSRDQATPEASPNLATCTGRACARWAGLTQAQAEVVVRFLEWRIAVNGPSWDSDAVEALAFFWRARAAVA